MIPMDVEQRYQLVTRNLEEIVTEDELRELLATNESPRAYIGFEPSGLVHIGWIVCVTKMRDLVDAGFEFVVFLADWHAYINDKLGADLDNIKVCAEYMKDCFEALGLPRDRARFLFASDILDEVDYWERLIRLAKVTSLSRVKRGMTIMGRSEDEAEVDSSKVMYPLMQATDIFAMDVDVAYGGMDQRRAHMLARDAADRLGWKKPIALHTPLLPGLRGGHRMDPIAAKMSKSDPDSGIMIHDSPGDIKRKIKKAYCPPEVEDNPIIELARHIVFVHRDEMVIDRPEKFGGPLRFESIERLMEAYAAGDLHPMDLKNGVRDTLVDILEPVRLYFEQKPDNLIAMRAVLDRLGR